jgi:hypothetical protein
MFMPEISFDFLEEIQKSQNYNALFPDEKAVRAILWLYAKITTGAFPAEKFKEEDIYHAFQATNLSGGYARLPQEHIHAHTANLLHYFLLYNEQDRLYTFRDYGKSFCKHAEEALAGNFNPTNIEIICKDLLIDLRKVTDRASLLSWLDLKFDAFEPKMSSQVDFLDRRINLAVSGIRDSAQLQTGEVLETLKKVDAHLEMIRGYNKELRSAFTALKDINTTLEENILLADDNVILDKLSHVQAFFPDIRYRLDLIDKRLDKLQPRLRQFFSALNQPLFNTRVESFLRFLLKSSTIQGDGSKKSIQFPAAISPIRVYQPTSRFIIVERREDLFPAISRKRPVYEETPEKRESAFRKMNDRILQQDSIEKWVARILVDCKQGQVITYSSYLIDMIEQQQGDIDLAARVTHRLMKIAAFGEIALDINTDTPVIYKNIKVWEMKIASR